MPAVKSLYNWMAGQNPKELIYLNSLMRANRQTSKWPDFIGVFGLFHLWGNISLLKASNFYVWRSASQVIGSFLATKTPLG